MIAVLDSLLVGLALLAACGWVVWFVEDTIAAGRRKGCGGKGCGCGKKFTIVRNGHDPLSRDE